MIEQVLDNLYKLECHNSEAVFCAIFGDEKGEALWDAKEKYNLPISKMWSLLEEAEQKNLINYLES